MIDIDNLSIKQLEKLRDSIEQKILDENKKNRSLDEKARSIKEKNLIKEIKPKISEFCKKYSNFTLKINIPIVITYPKINLDIDGNELLFSRDIFDLADTVDYYGKGSASEEANRLQKSIINSYLKENDGFCINMLRGYKPEVYETMKKEYNDLKKLIEKLDNLR